MSGGGESSAGTTVPAPLRAAGVVGGAIFGVIGLLGSVPKVLAGQWGSRSTLAVLDGVSLLAMLLLIYGLPGAILLVNAAAWRRGGRRLRRCVGVTALVSLGLVASHLLIATAPLPRVRFGSSGRASLDYTATRWHGLLSMTVSLVMTYGVVRIVTRSGASTAPRIVGEQLP